MRSFVLIMLFISSSISAQNYPETNQLTKSEFSFFGQKETLQNSFYQSDNIQSRKKYYSPINYFGQAAVGSGLSLIFALVPATATFAHAWNGDGEDFVGTALSILTLSSYLFGAATGVHWVAGVENKALSYWKTIVYSVIGGGAGAVLLAILAENYHQIPGFGGALVAASPVIGSMFYASFISDWRPPERNGSINKTSLTHTDLIEQSEIVKIEFLRIRF